MELVHKYSLFLLTHVEFKEAVTRREIRLSPRLRTKCSLSLSLSPSRRESEWARVVGMELLLDGSDIIEFAPLIEPLALLRRC